MSKKTDTEVLAGEIKKLTAAVVQNTRALNEAMGKSSAQTENLLKQLQQEEEIPQDETAQQMMERLSGGLMGAHNFPGLSSEGPEKITPLGGRVPFEGMFPTKPQQAPPGPGEKFSPQHGINVPREEGEQ